MDLEDLDGFSRKIYQRYPWEVGLAEMGDLPPTYGILRGTVR